jgi:deoxyribonuclease V
MAALDRLDRPPEVLVCDGFGIAHPRRFGLASHLGVLLDRPSFGVAENEFIGTYAAPGPGSSRCRSRPATGSAWPTPPA